MKPWEVWDDQRTDAATKPPGYLKIVVHFAVEKRPEKILFEERFQNHKSLYSAAWNASGLRTSATVPDCAQEASTEGG